MTVQSWLNIAIAGVALLLVPALAVLLRGAVKWTRTEDQLGELVRDVRELVEQQDKMHATIFDQIRTDREATDRRLRFLEEIFMRLGRDQLNPLGAVKIAP